MKTQISEIKRMQELAGLINEEETKPISAASSSPATEESANLAAFKKMLRDYSTGTLVISDKELEILIPFIQDLVDKATKGSTEQPLAQTSAFYQNRTKSIKP
jgi:hypothetical protein